MFTRKFLALALVPLFLLSLLAGGCGSVNSGRTLRKARMPASHEKMWGRKYLQNQMHRR